MKKHCNYYCYGQFTKPKEDTFLKNNDRSLEEEIFRHIENFRQSVITPQSKINYIQNKETGSSSSSSSTEVDVMESDKTIIKQEKEDNVPQELSVRLEMDDEESVQPTDNIEHANLLVFGESSGRTSSAEGLGDITKRTAAVEKQLKLVLQKLSSNVNECTRNRKLLQKLQEDMNKKFDAVLLTFREEASKDRELMRNMMNTMLQINDSSSALERLNYKGDQYCEMPMTSHEGKLKLKNNSAIENSYSHCVELQQDDKSLPNEKCGNISNSLLYEDKSRCKFGNQNLSEINSDDETYLIEREAQESNGFKNGMMVNEDSVIRSQINLSSPCIDFTSPGHEFDETFCQKDFGKCSSIEQLVLNLNPSEFVGSKLGEKEIDERYFRDKEGDQSPTPPLCCEKGKLKTFDVRELVKTNLPNIYTLLLSGSEVDHLHKKRLCRLFVDKMIELFGYFIKKEIMISIAERIVTVFPALGPVQFWYTPVRKKACSQGVLDTRLKNWRKRLPDSEKRAYRRKLQENYNMLNVNPSEFISCELEEDEEAKEDENDKYEISAPPLCEDEKLRNFDVRELVNKNLPKIYNLLESGTNVDHLQKKRLCRLFVDKMVEVFGYFIRKEIMASIAEKIVNTFNALGPVQLWYTTGRKQATSLGLLDQRLRNWRKKLPDSEKKYLKRKRADNENGDESSEDEAAQRLWLPADPSSPEPLKHNTSDLRNLSLMQIFERTVFSIDYINEMFKKFVPAAEADGLSNGFETFASRLCFNIYTFHRPAAIKAFEETKKFICNDDPDTIINAALMILPLMVPQGNVASTKGKRRKIFRPPPDLMMSNFIEIIDETVTGEETRERCAESGEVIPYIKCVTTAADNNKLKPSRISVVCGSQTIPSSSLLQAVDTTFKLFNILKLSYPLFCKNAYLFLETFFYKMKGNSPFVVSEFASHFSK